MQISADANNSFEQGDRKPLYLSVLDWQPARNMKRNDVTACIRPHSPRHPAPRLQFPRLPIRAYQAFGRVYIVALASQVRVLPILHQSVLTWVLHYSDSLGRIDAGF